MPGATKNMGIHFTQGGPRSLGEEGINMPEIICKICGRNFPKGYTNKKGEFVSGQGLLLNHVAIAHTNEYIELQEKLDNIYPEREEG
ncbi:hypothetical protein A2Z67_03825 [Candidatus Woesebacteria bacterium RBG_13_36_22]|uniref:Uncharacterized protein n=1 Tax=Candidatus Woesebacteria bacterium RBG_13_36_22 TaxID=1802478 RepID=A0A1F7X469_9BACT|nr:MAG: hypothetical protein A2Z67_03825 [Candidatus Woesebacteria bacterium RBG_13_36_22]